MFDLYKKVKMVFLILVLILSGTAYGQWRQHYGPRGQVNILYADSDVVFSYIDSSRIYKTAPESDNWQEAHNGIPGNVYIKAFMKVENLFFVAVSNNDDLKTVFISSDEGENWTQSSLTLEYDPMYMAYVDSVVFVAANSFGASPLHYSSDQGVTWQACNGLTEANQVGSLLFHNSKIFASTNMGFFVSEDSGINWVKKVGTGHPSFSSFSMMANLDGDKIHGLMAGFNGIIVYSSTDEGDTWQLETTSGFPSDGEWWFTTPMADASGENVFIIATQDAATTLPTIYTTGDYGLTWTQVGLPPFHPAKSLYVRGVELYVGTTAGILKSGDLGASWSEFSEGIIYNGNTSGFASVNGKLFTTFNGGLHSLGAYPSEWSPVPLPDSTLYLTSVFALNNILFTYTYNAILRSSDGGNNWDDIWDKFPDDFYPNVYGVGESTIYIGGREDANQKLYYSNDGGDTWNSNTFPGAYISKMEVIGSTVYMISGSIYKTTDNGATWIEFASTGLGDNPNINSVIEYNGKTIIFNWAYSGTLQAYYSDNEGATWNTISGLGDENIVNSFYVKDNLVFAATRKGVFVSDNGETWTTKNDGLGTVSVNQIYSTGKHYVASVFNRAVWFIEVPNLTGVENTNLEQPNSFVLHQNYPNPFNPTTMIKYGISEKSNIKVEIFNMLGQSVAVLVDSEKAIGFYETAWNAANLPSGIYLISIRAEGLDSKKNFAQVKKAILLK